MSSTDTRSDGFGITLHHEGQNDQNSLAPSPSGGTGDINKQEARDNDNQSDASSSTQQGKLNEDAVKNNKA